MFFPVPPLLTRRKRRNVKNRFTIGRDASADVPIADPSVSRLHAEAVLDGARLLLTDRGSSNGTYVIRGGAARPLTQEALEARDVVRFGTVDIAVADLIDIIRIKSGAVHLPGPAPLPRSERLVRCDCGAVKSVSRACEFCGT